MVQAQAHRYEMEEQMLRDDAGMTDRDGLPELVHLTTLKTHHFDTLGYVRRPNRPFLLL